MEEQLFTTEAAKRLEIGVSTLRNYAAILENKGYYFERGMNNGRIFQKEDLQLISDMSRKMLTEGITVEQAAHLVVKNNPKGQAKKQMIDEVMIRLERIEAEQKELRKINEQFVQLLERLTGKIEDKERDALLMQRRENMKKKQVKLRTSFSWPLISLKGK